MAAETTSAAPTCALILAGGSGTRFWPLSRRSRPKQLLSLMGDVSLLRGTVDRLAPLVKAEDAFCSTTVALEEKVLADLGGSAEASTSWQRRVFAEPMGRNTLPAIAWCVDGIDQNYEGQDPVVVVLPSDHFVTEPDGFRQALAAAVTEAQAQDRIVTLGVPPRWAETGYGYLELKSAVDGLGVYDVARFTEKPDEERAEAFVKGGRHLWNAGIFVFRASVFAAAARRFQPEMMELVESLRGVRDPDRLAELYSQMPNVSIDFGLMEALEDIAAVPLDCGWNDLGSWDALAAVLEVDEAGNRIRGDVVAVDSGDNLLVADRGTIAAVGVSGLVVVRTEDSVLVLPQGRAQDVRKVVDALKASDREDLL